ncbi:MAG TPA: hypothetical protein VF156_01805, partial [Agromyces sp.]
MATILAHARPRARTRAGERMSRAGEHGGAHAVPRHPSPAYDEGMQQQNPLDDPAADPFAVARDAA